MKSWCRTTTASIVLLLLVGCTSYKPTVPEVANRSFRKAVEERAGTHSPTLANVRESFEALQTGTRTASKEKHDQEWNFAAATAGGGFAAVLGQIASKTGLLNTGLGVAMGGLALNGLYQPSLTKETHLSADEMFVCIQSELGRVNDGERENAKRATKGADKAASAVDDVIAQVDHAISRYRRSVLTQQATTPTRDDFADFAKRYARQDIDATTQASNAAENRAKAERQIENARVTLAKAKGDKQTPNEGGKELDPKILAAETAYRTALMQQQDTISQAEADAAGALFINFSTKLEACVKQFTK